jgi:hypothetical protein
MQDFHLPLARMRRNNERSGGIPMHSDDEWKIELRDIHEAVVDLDARLKEIMSKLGGDALEYPAEMDELGEH